MRYFIFIILIGVVNSTTAQISQKRKAPNEVKPLISGNIKYSAPTNEIGYIVAQNINTNSIIWKKQIYQIIYNRNLESDVQDVFIDSLNLQEHYLIIHTENNKTYFLDLIKMIIMNAKSFLTSGNGKAENKDYLGAIEDFTRAIELTSDSATLGEIYFKRATANFHIQNSEATARDLTKAFEFDPKYNQELFWNQF